MLNPPLLLALWVFAMPAPRARADAGAGSDSVGGSSKLAGKSMEPVPAGSMCGADGQMNYPVPSALAKEMCAGFLKVRVSQEIKQAFQSCNAYYSEAFFALDNHCLFMQQAIALKAGLKAKAAGLTSAQNAEADGASYANETSDAFSKRWRDFFYQEGHRLDDAYSAYKDKLEVLAVKGNDVLDNETEKCGQAGSDPSLASIGMAAVSAAELVHNHRRIRPFVYDLYYRTGLASNQIASNQRVIDQRPDLSTITGDPGNPGSSPAKPYVESVATTSAGHEAGSALEHAGKVLGRTMARSAPLVGPASDLSYRKLSRTIEHGRLDWVDYTFSGTRFVIGGAQLLAAPESGGMTIAADIVVDNALTAVEDAVRRKVDSVRDAKKKKLAQILSGIMDSRPDSAALSSAFHDEAKDGKCGTTPKLPPAGSG